MHTRFIHVHACTHVHTYTQKKQIVVGDQLTCKVIRGCKLWRWRQGEIEHKDRLSWANEVPGVVYFEINLIYSVVSMVVFLKYRRLSLSLGVSEGAIHDLVG